MTVWMLMAVLAQAVPSDAVVARVGNDPITAGEVAARVRPAGRAASVIEGVDELISEATLAQAARAGKVALEPAAKARIAAQRRSLAVARMLEAEAYAKVSVGDEQVKELFHASNDEVRLGLVVRATRDEAQGVLDRLSRGGAFAAEVKDSLDAASKDRGGDLPWMKRGGLPPDLAKAAFSAPIGKPAGPFQAAQGFAVVVVRDRKIADDAALAAQKDQLRAAAEAGARDEAAARLLDGVRRAKGAKLDQAALAHLGGKDKPSKLELATAVATAGTIKVTLKEVRAESAGAGAHGGGARMSEAVAARLLDAKLLEAVAAERGYAKDAKVAARVRGLERALLAQAYAEKIRKGAAAPTPAEVEARYKERPQDFVQPPRRRCWQVVAKSEDAAAKLRARLAGGEAFEKVAKESVNAPTAAKGGLIGEIPDPQLDAIAKTKDAAVAETLRKLAPGELSAPVVNSAGDYHVFRCEAKLPERTRPLEEVRAELTSGMRAERGEAAVRAKVVALRKSAAVSMEDATLAQLSAELKPPKDAMHGGMGGMGGGHGEAPPAGPAGGHQN